MAASKIFLAVIKNYQYVILEQKAFVDLEKAKSWIKDRVEHYRRPGVDVMELCWEDFGYVYYLWISDASLTTHFQISEVNLEI